MFLTFTPNPCLERVLRLDQLGLGASHRVDSDQIFESLGGKGANAARVASRMGVPVMAFLPVDASQLSKLQNLSERENLPVRLLPVQNSLRVCTSLISPQGLTEIVEAGEAPPLSNGTQMLATWRELLPSCELALIGGSYPVSKEKGWELHGAILCQMAQAAGKKLIYDGKGAAFRRAIFASPALPWAIKPNIDEASELLRRPITNRAEERAAVRDLRARGIEVVLMSCGARGLYVGWQNFIEFLPSPRVETISAVGSGDSLVGAFAAKYLETGDVWEAAKWGVAAGAANAAHMESAFVGKDDIAPLVPLVKPEIAEIKLNLA